MSRPPLTVAHLRARLSRLMPELRDRYGIGQVQVFGSVARGEAGPESDIDLLVEFTRPIGLMGMAALRRELSEALGAQVDLATRAALHPQLREAILREAVLAA